MAQNLGDVPPADPDPLFVLAPTRTAVAAWARTVHLPTRRFTVVSHVDALRGHVGPAVVLLYGWESRWSAAALEEIREVLDSGGARYLDASDHAVFAPWAASDS